MTRMPPGPRVVVLSGRRTRRRVWHASQYEFEDVIAEVDQVRMLAPELPAVRSGTGLPAKVLSRRAARPLWGRRPSTGDEPVAADLFFGVFSAAHELADLAAVRDHVDACATKIAFVVEMWRPRLPQERAALRHLRGFDHVFLFSRGVMPDVQDITGVPCSYLPTAVDALRFSPADATLPRPIAVTSYGHRLAGTHEPLVRAVEAGRLHYAFDTVRGPFDVHDHREHRLALAQQLRHSRYAIVYRNNDHEDRRARTGGEEALTNRQFEVLASGAVLLGSRPDVPDFDDCFGWLDSLVEIPAPAPDVEDLLSRLERDPERVAAIRATNIARSLELHDWGHRWRRVLDVADLPPLPALDERDRRLTARARLVRSTTSARRATGGGG